jgi:hypothetical protein
MRKLSLIFFALIPLLGICQPQNNKGKFEDPFGVSVTVSPGFTKLSPDFSSAFSYDLGGNFAFFFKDNIWASAGFGYSHKSFNQNALSLKGKNTGNISSTLDYYEFPVVAHYRTGDFSRVTHDEKKHLGHQAKVGFTASGGIVPGLLWDGKINYTGNGTDHQYDQKDLKHAGYKNIVSVQGSAGVYYHLTHHFFLTVEPQIKYSLSHIPKDSKYRWQTIGVNVTLWYRIIPKFGM